MDNNTRFNRRIKLTQDIVATIAKTDEFKGLWQGSLRLSPQILGRLKKWVIITSTGASTRIEGAKMTDEEIARFLRGLTATIPASRDEQEVAGYADVIGRVFDSYRSIPLSENWILQLHSMLLQFSEKDTSHRGKYKATNNRVVMTTSQGEQAVLFEPTPPYLVQPEMERIVSWTNDHLKTGEIHPLLVISNFIFEFLAIHPFTDGNGRISRALTNLLLLKAGYSYVPYIALDEIIEETKAEYYLSLRATQKNHKTDHEDITPWIEYLLHALLEQAERARKVIDQDQPEKLLSEKQLRIYHLFEKGETLSVSDVMTTISGEISEATVKKVVARLVKLQLLDRIGQARSTRYKKFEEK